MRGLKRFLRILLAVLVLAAIAFAVFSAYLISTQRAAVARLEDRIDRLKSEFTPLRFMVLSRSDSSVSARFRFYDAEGREISSFERSWNGSELAIDSVLVPVGDRVLAFPSRVFTDAIAPRRGTVLFGYYNRDGFPAIFDSPSLDGATRAALADLFDRVRIFDGPEWSGDPGPLAALKGVYGSAVHDLRRLRVFEVGAVYSLTVRAAGGIEILRE